MMIIYQTRSMFCPHHSQVFNLPDLCWLFPLGRVSVMTTLLTLLCLVIVPALLSAQLSYQVSFCSPRGFRENPFAEERFICKIFQVPESLAADAEIPNSGLNFPVKRTYVLHRGPNGEPRWQYYSDQTPVLTLITLVGNQSIIKTFLLRFPPLFSLTIS